jgi:hypothetical protein
MNVIKEYIDKNYNIDCLLGGENSELYREVSKLVCDFAIEQLKQHIEHPTKPGYRRHDILNKIKQLEKIEIK